MLKKVMLYASFFGAQFIKIEDESGAKAAAYIIKDGDNVIIKEAALNGMSADSVLEIVKENTDAKTYILKTAPDIGESADYAVICNLSNEEIDTDNIYFNLAMD